jgi:hypothetical protein
MTTITELVEGRVVMQTPGADRRALQGKPGAGPGKTFRGSV